MGELPLHPSIVHVPLGIGAIMPLVAGALALCIWRGWLPRRAWLGAIVLQAMVTGGGLVAMETGEDEEERVERVVAESKIEEHEERAEQFVWTSAATLGVMVVAFALPGEALLVTGAGVATLATVVTLAMGYRVGHSGGELVYRHGAAAAYTEASTPSGKRARSDD